MTKRCAVCEYGLMCLTSGVVGISICPQCKKRAILRCPKEVFVPDAPDPVPGTVQVTVRALPPSWCPLVKRKSKLAEELKFEQFPLCDSCVPF